MQTDNTIFLAAEELQLAKDCTRALVRIADALSQRDVPPGDVSALSPNSTLHSQLSTLNSPEPAPAEAPVTKTDLRAFLMTKDKDAVRSLFTEFGVSKFSEITEDQYPLVLASAKTLPDKEAA